MRGKPLTYQSIVKQIKTRYKATIEARFTIGLLVERALTDGASIEALSRDTEVSRMTLVEYRDTAMFWGKDRPVQKMNWYDYRQIARWPADEAQQAKASIMSGRIVGEVVKAFYERHAVVEPLQVDPWRQFCMDLSRLVGTLEQMQTQPPSEAVLRQLRAVFDELAGRLATMGLYKAA